ncbi:WAT1-related protein At2g39510 [Amborella trichopoda]|uniref:WAT1-related protein At2g39510 n=1 Tax=Amborella trichopoda TaxID=13333 RepID=UPI0009BF01A1|nr:WAT1-related protein At2g39510 [Amborella trichopoda]|eukprot:XP_011620876.2 WAT1-related protein At2g39510 [Amborella trichopoda]
MGVGGYGPVLSQLVFNSSAGVMYILIKAALEHGMNRYVFVTYRQAAATLAIVPLAFFLDRITLEQILYFSGIDYTTSTYAATTTNLIPAIAFVMACVLRLERANIKSPRGQAKVIGTIICVGGAMIMTFIKGPTVEFFHYLKTSKSLSDILGAKSLIDTKKNLTLGIILLIISVTSYSAWISYQAWVFKDCPAQLSLTALMLLGVFCSAIAFFIQSWCIKKRGPIFAAAFFPLSSVITAILEPIFLHVDLHVGSAVGMIVIIVGLYAVLWGKAKDRKGSINILPQDELSSFSVGKEGGERESYFV